MSEKMHSELEKRRNYIDRLKNLALFAKNQQDRVIDIQQTTASLAAQDFKLRRLKMDFPSIPNTKKVKDKDSAYQTTERSIRGKSESVLGRLTSKKMSECSQTTERFSELNKMLDDKHRTNINQEGFFGKLNKYQYQDLVKLKEEPLNQQKYGKPTIGNNATIKQLVNNYYQKEFIQEQQKQEQRYQQNLKHQLDRLKNI